MKEVLNTEIRLVVGIFSFFPTFSTNGKHLRRC